ncbi:MAG: N,N-dimethylformamidase beta subunit family domain-containing protein [Solirubrobacteraceae bacterium]
MPELTGYADPFSVAPGAFAEFFVHTDARDYDARIVRLLHGDSAPEGPGFKAEAIPSEVAGRHPGQSQRTSPGSFLVAEDQHGLPPVEGLTIIAWIQPSALAARPRQGLVARWASRRSGFALVIEDGQAAFILRAAGSVVTVRSGARLVERSWHLVVARYRGEERRIEIRQRCAAQWMPAPAAANREECPAAAIDMAPGVWTLGAAAARPAGAAWIPEEPYDGKLESPVVIGEEVDDEAVEDVAAGADPSAVSDRVIAAWDFAPRGAGTPVPDRGLHQLTAYSLNMPYSAVTGHNWSGRETDFKRAPHEYRALQFNSDALTDARWDVSLRWRVSPGLRSGVYALRVEDRDDVDHVPFVIRPPRGKPGADVAVLLPTLTYWAYANERSLSPELLSRWRPVPDTWRVEADPRDAYLARHPEYGKSLYDHHDDGTGCSISSRRRPIPNLRPDYRYHATGAGRHLGGDLYLVDWLEARGFSYDVITDEDLHTEGAGLLSGYRAVMTGSHPEYATDAMLDALERYVFGGGRLMYLGGNGLWWVTSLCGDEGSCIEQRRGYAGSRLWESPPGECYHASTGELGGVWRHRGRSPNRLLGTGTSAYGHDGDSRGYVRTPESFDPEVGFVFEGIAPDETIGGFGLSMGGAAGDEIDRADVELGTPPTARVLATATGFGDTYQVVIEDLQQTAAHSGGRHHPNVRADMLYWKTPEGGAVFSVGSIAWTASLSHDGYENNVSRVTENVLRRFSGDVWPGRQPNEGCCAASAVPESSRRNPET